MYKKKCAVVLSIHGLASEKRILFAATTVTKAGVQETGGKSASIAS